MSFLEKLKAYMQELGEDEDDFEEEDPVPGAQTSSTNLDRKAKPKETHGRTPFTSDSAPSPSA